MSGKTFRTKHRSSSTALISLHFNKADEDQLEISYGEKSDSEGAGAGKNDSLLITEKGNNESSSNGDFDETFEDFNISADAGEPTKIKSESRESTPVRDSVVKEYWSRISRRAGSLDSDMGYDRNQDSSEGWMFFKDIKGKISKTLEERKSKDTGAKPTSVFEKASVIKEKDGDEADADVTPTDSDSKSDFEKYLKLSPAVEAAEIINENNMFESYVNDELEKAKCEIIPGKKKPSPSRKSVPHSMTLSSLIANRSASIEDDESIANLKDASITSSYVKKEENAHKTKNLMNNENMLHKLIQVVRQYYCYLKSSWNNFLFRLLTAVFVFILAPIPSWLCGFLIGSLLSGAVMYWLFKPGTPKKPFCLPNYNQMPEINIPVSEEPIIYKGWMNELPTDMNYNPDTYHVNCTRSLYVRLDGSYLRVSYPHSNIPKRAMFNETRHERQFISQQHFDITDASVELLPKGLARKRLWSKKYPICLRIPNSKQAVLSNFAKEADESSVAKSAGRKESPIKRCIPRINENNEVVLYLFSRTDRDKDLWYYRFKKASKVKMLKSHSPSSSPNIAAIDSSSLENKRTISVDLASLQLCSSYNNDDASDTYDEIDSFVDVSMTKQQKFELYMSHLLAPLHLDSFSTSLKDKRDLDKISKTSSAAQNNLAWLNVLIGRVFYDFLTEDMWAQLVAERIQRKLSKIKLPVFLTELIVKNINLGTALPKIHRASEPTTDQRGLWIDIDLSYNGSFQMTLETKLNLLRYKKATEELSLSDVLKGNESANPLRSPVYNNSDEEDSAESSSDEDIPIPEIEN
ncbi:testis-expressed protein 2-like [Uloborus diversus]|uniref:testis-expressed protein 2-like n=1 Tax=Uloborus diversus TaxID=327109 RepID=UPI0024097F48|nr:testis-expressed protein 2-like [Uloborus diversus]